MIGHYSAKLICRVREAKRRGKIGKGVLLLHDNAPVHSAQVAKRAIRDAGFEEINHAPYSSDLTPSDYFLFRNLKKDIRGHIYRDEEEMMATVEEHFAGKSKSYFF